MSSHAHQSHETPVRSGSFFSQPRAVWAVAFACVIAFMGIGLVDPILPVLAQDLDATPSQVSLLFTSYFAITGVSMLVTGYVSSRIGPRRTLLGGLVLVIVFSALAGLSGSIPEIVGFRAGWGLGNALFISTALATIVGAASGGSGAAIVLYEAALGASYGGYMANWLLGHTNRFKCIVSHDGMFNAESAYGTTEELWFANWEFGGPPWKKRDVYRKWSPHEYAANFKTPTLVVHGQNDYRLDVSQGFDLFTTLQVLKVPSKMLYFPDEGHWVLKPQNSQLWYKTVNDWVDQWCATK